MPPEGKHEEGDYHSERGYYHNCPVCLKGFWGRENKIYHKKCKSIRAKQLRREREKLSKSEYASMWSNARLLERFWRKFKGAKVPLQKLLAAGFDTNGPSRMLYDDETGVTHSIVCGFVYQLCDNNTNILIQLEHELTTN